MTKEEYEDLKSLFVEQGKLDMLRFLYDEFRNNPIIKNDMIIYSEIHKIIGKAIQTIK